MAAGPVFPVANGSGPATLQALGKRLNFQDVKPLEVSACLQKENELVIKKITALPISLGLGLSAWGEQEMATVIWPVINTNKIQYTLDSQRPWGGCFGHNSKMGYHTSNLSDCVFFQVYQAE